MACGMWHVASVWVWCVPNLSFQPYHAMTYHTYWYTYWWIDLVRNWTGGSSESGTGQELDERVRNWTDGSSESGTGQVGRTSLELDRNWTSESGTGQMDRASQELDK